jgi:hypothetical protein
MLICRYAAISLAKDKENSPFTEPAAACAAVRGKSEAACVFYSE